jgi:hypothetical protein
MIGKFTRPALLFLFSACCPSLLSMPVRFSTSTIPLISLTR